MRGSAGPAGRSAADKSARARYDFSPYGELMRSAGLPLTTGYTGHRWDPAIGQYFAPFRYYNPQTARWNMRDPLGHLEGVNMYAYLVGNPVMAFDPMGLGPFDDGSTLGAFCNGAMDGALQFLDVANPFGSPFENGGFYNPEDPGMHSGRVAGEIGITAASLAGGGEIAKVGKGFVSRVRAGKEISFGKNIRVAPFGNSTASRPAGKVPH